ncbi:hypothetical protein GKE55_11370 [Gordonibacter pamelaeae]|uniref:Peptidyl-prolyl cis-trans isomerase n=2 Tax=Eggerthellaceae TaxID=1643826 RepID=A0A423ULZ8_9ACTN|nr:hypothetical protein [Gordonibacter pamelaeae]MSA95167.1 hypothetical protein [Gordonibacter urolithinfaciens]ROT89588.1 peptidylprolyl isomerase [Gordonibacter urolithinfaciens]ROT90875.1 peptidylprolyl isomerase [Gordonibacter urolithinfaciens]
MRRVVAGRGGPLPAPCRRFTFLSMRKKEIKTMQLGSTVTLVYTGKLDDGTVFGFATEEKPMKFQTGMDMAIEGFEKAILEMNEAGEKKTFTVDEYGAYGEYLEGHVAKIPLEQIPVNDVKVGKRIMLSSSEDGAPMPATVLDITDGLVTFDLNHPLAGKSLTFEVELLEVEDAPEDFVSAAEKAQHLKEQAKLLGGDQGEDFR